MNRKLQTLALAGLMTTGLAGVTLAATGEGPTASGTPDTVGTQTGSQQVGTPATGSRTATPNGQYGATTPGSSTYSYPTPRPGGMSADASGRPVGAARTPQTDSGFQNSAPPSNGGSMGSNGH